jgi:mevalonate kinase
MRKSCEWSLSDRVDTALEALSSFLSTHRDVFDEWLDVDRLSRDVTDGWYLPSSIPIGYGAGSSGSVVAAIYDRYGDGKDLSLTQVRDRLSAIEGFYHGTSSGIDPLVSLTDSAIMKVGQDLQQVDLPSGVLGHYHLLDTGQARSTKPLVEWYKARLFSDPVFGQRMEDVKSSQDLAIAALLDGDSNKLKQYANRISEMQYNRLSELIPDDLMHWWSQTLDTDTIAPKLCGAGGGGYILVWRELGISDIAMPDLDIVSL